MSLTTSDSELLAQFRNPDTKEKAYTIIIRKYQEKLYWHIRRMVVAHDDANDVLQNVLSLLKNTIFLEEWGMLLPSVLQKTFLYQSNMWERKTHLAKAALQKIF